MCVTQLSTGNIYTIASRKPSFMYLCVCVCVCVYARRYHIILICILCLQLSKLNAVAVSDYTSGLPRGCFSKRRVIIIILRRNAYDTQRTNTILQNIVACTINKVFTGFRYARLY